MKAQTGTHRGPCGGYCSSRVDRRKRPDAGKGDSKCFTRLSNHPDQQTLSEYLELTVDSILHQSVLPVQLIVVDQSEDDESRRRIETLLFEAPLRVRDAVALDYLRNAAISAALLPATGRWTLPGKISGCSWTTMSVSRGILSKSSLPSFSGIHAYREFQALSQTIMSLRGPTDYGLRFLSVDLFTMNGNQSTGRRTVSGNSEPFAVRKLGAGLMSFRAESIRFHRFDENLAGVCDGEDVDFCARLGPEETLMIAPRARLVQSVSPIGRSQKHRILRFAKANF